MNSPVFTLPIPAWSWLTILGKKRAGAGQSFDVSIPTHTDFHGDVIQAHSTKCIGQNPFECDMSPGVMDSSRDLLIINIVFYWWNGETLKWVMGSDFKQTSARDGTVVVGFNDNLAGGSNYTNQEVKIMWGPLLTPQQFHELHERVKLLEDRLLALEAPRAR
jgi:hypothetical protein